MSEKLIHSLRFDFRAAVLGMALAAGFSAPSWAQQTPPEASPEQELESLEKFDYVIVSDYIDARVDAIRNEFAAAHRLPDAALEARIRAAGIHAHRISGDQELADLGSRLRMPRNSQLTAYIAEIRKKLRSSRP